VLFPVQDQVSLPVTDALHYSTKKDEVARARSRQCFTKNYVLLNTTNETK